MVQPATNQEIGMMATVYAAVYERDDADYRIHRVHRDPTCANLTRWDNTERIVALPANISTGTATLTRVHTALTNQIPVCKICLRYEPADQTLQAQAACRDRDDISWFPLPEATQTEQRNNIYAAKQVCKDCPVKKTCIDYAGSANMDVGIWGGLNHHYGSKDRQLIGKEHK